MQPSPHNRRVEDQALIADELTMHFYRAMAFVYASAIGLGLGWLLDKPVLMKVSGVVMALTMLLLGVAIYRLNQAIRVEEVLRKQAKACEEADSSPDEAPEMARPNRPAVIVEELA